jgi:hypothetical protein
MFPTNLQMDTHTVPDTYFIGNPTSAFSIWNLRMRVWPILATIGLGFLVLIPSGLANVWVTHLIGTQRIVAMPWLLHFVDHAMMIVMAVILIAWLGKGHFSDFGLQWPKGKSYVLAAITWGTFFGVFMTVVDYFPQIRARTPPPDNLALTPSSLVGWLGFEAIFVGFGEEIPFRGTAADLPDAAHLRPHPHRQP